MANELQFVKFARRGNPYLGAIINEVVDSPWWDLPFVTEGWDAATTSTVTAPGGFCSSWAPVKGTHAFTQATGANQPAWANGVLTFTAALSHFMQTNNFTLDQPFEMTGMIAPTGYNSGANQGYFAGKQGDVLFFNPNGGSNLAIYGGSTVASAAGPTAGTWHVVSVMLDSGSSESLWQVDLNAPNTAASPGVLNPGGFTLGASSAGIQFGGMMCKAFCYSPRLTSAQRAQLAASMLATYP